MNGASSKEMIVMVVSSPSGAQPYAFFTGGSASAGTWTYLVGIITGYVTFMNVYMQRGSLMLSHITVRTIGL